MQFRTALMALTLGLSVLSGSSMAQQGPDQGQGGGGGGGGGGDRQRGNFNPAEFQQRMMERIKEQLKAPDDEWQVLQPKIEKVFTAQRNSRAGDMGGWGRRGGGGEGGGGDRQRENNNNQPQSEVAKASADLRSAIRSENPSEQDIETKLAALRAAREKAAEELKTARQELKELISVQQEATLVLAGLLE